MERGLTNVLPLPSLFLLSPPGNSRIESGSPRWNSRRQIAHFHELHLPMIFPNASVLPLESKNSSNNNNCRLLSVGLTDRWSLQIKIPSPKSSS